MSDALKPKSSSVSAVAKEVLRNGIAAADPVHGVARMQERGISLEDLREVIESGYFTGRIEEKRDFIPPNRTYTFRGWVDDRLIETSVYFRYPGGLPGTGPLDFSKAELYFLTCYVRDTR